MTLEPRSRRRTLALRRSAALRRCCAACGAPALASALAVGELCLTCRRWKSVFDRLQAIDDGIVLSRFCLHC